MKKKPAVSKILGSPLVWAFAAFNVLVALWMLLSSVKTSAEIFSDPWGLPDVVEWGNYSRAWTQSHFGRATLNTLVVVFATAVTTVALAAPAAYVLARVISKTSRRMTAFFAIGLGVPAQAIVLPLYVAMAELNLVDSLFGLYLLYTATSIPFTVFFLTGFFGSLPAALEEAAALDGASAWRTFWQVMLPLARGGIVTVLILNILQHWGETLFALIFLQSTENETLSVALLGFLGQMQYNGADWGGLFAGVTIIVLPVLVCYVWLGRRIIEGMTIGSVK